jgi:aspartyl-tRNA(Asn)/glutamyl-tRNA(Gln) amidotransferase subunit C
MAKLSKEDVLHIAKLSKLKLSDAEVEKFKGQLSSVLEYVGELSKVDTKGVEATAQVTGLTNVFDEDKISSEKTSYEEIKINAPKFEEGAYKVPGVFNAEN